MIFGVGGVAKMYAAMIKLRIYRSAHHNLVPIMICVQKPPLNAHADVSSRDSGLIPCLLLPLLPYFVYA